METKQVIKWYDLDQENNVITLFADKLYKDRKAHYAELFKCFFSNPKINHSFKKYTPSQQLRFFKTKPLYFVVRADYVYLQNGFLKPSCNVYPKISGAVNFLLRCYDTLHYLDIKKVIMFIFDDVARYIYQVSFENERALIKTIPNVIFDESGEMKLVTHCEMRTQHVTLDDKMLLAMVCYLVLYGKTFREHLLKRIESIAPVEFESLFRGSTAKQWNFLEQHIDYFRISGNEVVQLYEHYASFNYDYQGKASEGPPFCRSRTNAERNFSRLRRTVRAKLPDTVTRKDNLIGSRGQRLREIEMLNLNKKFCTAVQFLLNYCPSENLHYLELTETICFVLKDVGTYLLGMSSSSRKKVFSKVPSTTMDEMGFLEMSHSTLEATTKKESIRLDLNLISKDELLLLYIVYYLSLNGRTHFETVIKEMRNQTPQVISMILTCASTPMQLAYLKKHQQHFRIDGEFYLELPSTFVLPVGSSSGDSSDDAQSFFETDGSASIDHYCSSENMVGDLSVVLKDKTSDSYINGVEARLNESDQERSRRTGASSSFENTNKRKSPETLNKLKGEVSYNFVNGVDTRSVEPSFSWSSDTISPVNGENINLSRTYRSEEKITSFTYEVDRKSRSRDSSISSSSLNNDGIKANGIVKDSYSSGNFGTFSDFYCEDTEPNYCEENEFSNNVDGSGWTFVKSKNCIQISTNHSTEQKNQLSTAVSPVNTRINFISERLFFATLYLLKFSKSSVSKKQFLKVILHVLRDVSDYFSNLSSEDKLNFIRVSFAVCFLRRNAVSSPAEKDSILSQKEKQLLYFCYSTHFNGKSYYDKLYDEFFIVNKCTPSLGTYSDKLMYFKNLKEFFIVDNDGYVKSCSLSSIKIDPCFFSKVFESFHSESSPLKVSPPGKKSNYATAVKDENKAAKTLRSQEFFASTSRRIVKLNSPEIDIPYVLLNRDDIQYCGKETSCVGLNKNRFALLEMDDVHNSDMQIVGERFEAQDQSCKNNLEYKKFCESVLFLITAFGPLHYSHLMQCIMHILTDVDEWLKKLSKDEQQEVFKSILPVTLNSDNCMHLATPYKYNTKYVSKKKLRLLYIVSYLALHGKTHAYKLLEELYRSVPELTISNFTGPEDSNWLRLLRQFSKYYQINSRHILSVSFASDGQNSVPVNSSLPVSGKMLPIESDHVKNEFETLCIVDQEILDCSKQNDYSVKAEGYFSKQETLDVKPCKQPVKCTIAKEEIGRKPKLCFSLPSLPCIAEENISVQSEEKVSINNGFEYKVPQNKESLDLTPIISNKSVSNKLIKKGKTKSSEKAKNNKSKVFCFSEQNKNDACEITECSITKKENSDLSLNISSTMLHLLNNEDSTESYESTKVESIPESNSSLWCRVSTESHNEKPDNPISYNADETKSKLRRKLKARKKLCFSNPELSNADVASDLDTKAHTFKQIENKDILVNDSFKSPVPVVFGKENNNFNLFQTKFNFNMTSKPLIDAVSTLHPCLNSKETELTKTERTEFKFPNDDHDSKSVQLNYFWLMEVLSDNIKKMPMMRAAPSVNQVDDTLRAIQCPNEVSNKFCLTKQEYNLDNDISHCDTYKKCLDETAVGMLNSLKDVYENPLVSKNPRSSPTNLLKKFKSLKSPKSPQNLADKSSALVRKGELSSDGICSPDVTHVVKKSPDLEKTFTTQEIEVNNDVESTFVSENVDKTTSSFITVKTEFDIDKISHSHETNVAEESSDSYKNMFTDNIDVNADVRVITEKIPKSISKTTKVGETSSALEKHFVGKPIHLNTVVASNSDIAYEAEDSDFTKSIVKAKPSSVGISVTNITHGAKDPLSLDIAAISEKAKSNVPSTYNSNITDVQCQNLVPKSVDIPKKICSRMITGVEFLWKTFKCVPDLHLMNVVLHSLYEAKYAFLLLPDSDQINLVKKILATRVPFEIKSNCSDMSDGPSSAFELSQEQKILLLYSYILSRSPKIHYLEVPLKFKIKGQISPFDISQTYSYFKANSSFFVIDNFGYVTLKSFPSIKWKSSVLTSNSCINLKDNNISGIAMKPTVDVEKKLLKRFAVLNEVTKCEKFANKNKTEKLEAISQGLSTMKDRVKFNEVVEPMAENVTRKNITTEQKESSKELIVTEESIEMTATQTEKNLLLSKQKTTSKEKYTIQRDAAFIKTETINSNDIKEKSSRGTSTVKGVSENKNIKKAKDEQIDKKLQTLLQELSESLHDSIVYLMQYFELKANTWFLEVALHVVEGCAPFFELSHLLQQEVIKTSLRHFYINKQQTISYPYTNDQRFYKLKWDEQELLCLTYIIIQRGQMHYREVFKKYGEYTKKSVQLSDSDQIWFFKGREDLFFVTMSGHVNLVNVPVIKLDFKSVLGSNETCNPTPSMIEPHNTLNSSSITEDFKFMEKSLSEVKFNLSTQSEITSCATIDQMSIKKSLLVAKAELPSHTQNSSTVAKKKPFAKLSSHSQDAVYANKSQMFAEKKPAVIKVDLPPHIQDLSGKAKSRIAALGKKPPIATADLALHNSSCSAKDPLSTEKRPLLVKPDVNHEINISSNDCNSFSKPKIEPGHCSKLQCLCSSTNVESGTALIFSKRIKESLIFLGRSFETVSSQQIIRTFLHVLHDVRNCFIDETDFYYSTMKEMVIHFKSEKKVFNQLGKNFTAESLSEQEKDLLVLTCILIISGPMYHKELFRRFRAHGRNVELTTSSNQYLYLQKKRMYFAINDSGDVSLSKNQTSKALDLDGLIRNLELRVSFQSALLEGCGIETLSYKNRSQRKFSCTDWIGSVLLGAIRDFCNDLLTFYRSRKSHNESPNSGLESSTGVNHLASSLQNRVAALSNDSNSDSKTSKFEGYLALKKAHLRLIKKQKNQNDGTLPHLDKKHNDSSDVPTELSRCDVQHFKDVAKTTSSCDNLSSCLGPSKPVLFTGMCNQSDASSLTSKKSPSISTASNYSNASKDKSMQDTSPSEHGCSANIFNNCINIESQKDCSNPSRIVDFNIAVQYTIPNEAKSSGSCDNVANCQKISMSKQKDETNSAVVCECGCTKDASKELKTLNFFVFVLSRSRGGLTFPALADRLLSAPNDVQHYIACVYGNNIRKYLQNHATFYISPTSSIVYWRR